MVWLVVAALAAIPLVAFLVAYRLSARRLLPGVAAAAITGSALGAFLASAASAMSTAANPANAFLRGGSIGLAAGALLGILAALLVRATSRKPRPTPPFS